MAKILPIVINPNKILRTVSKKVDQKIIDTDDFKKFCKDLIKTMIEKDGVGLAAPQVGQNIRVIAVNTKEGTFCLINPEFIKKSWAKEIAEEGCLSVPKIFGDVKRHRKVTCTYLNEKGKEIILKAEGLMARVLQHETDHLDGILFIDTAKNLKNYEVKTK